VVSSSSWDMQMESVKSLEASTVPGMEHMHTTWEVFGFITNL